MNAPPTQIVELTEYATKSFPREDIPDSVAEALWRNHSAKVAVEFPSPKTAYKWELTAQGWVGYIPLSPELRLWLRPKVELSNLFHMLEYAYHLKSFIFLEGLFECQSLQEFYERLANVLAKRILNRGRQGFYRTYVPRTERLPYLRGRLEIPSLVRAPWDANMQCHYHEHTADVEENQILAWTLFTIARSGMCSERAMPAISRAHRALQGFVTLVPQGPEACTGRLYHRLNDDYRPLHALCRFFLEHSGPHHETGDRTMVPFLVDMARLFELFVAEWLAAHLPEGLELKPQESVAIGDGDTPGFVIDLVLYDTASGTARCVMDTKYKTPTAPSTEDIAQIVAYAEARGCQDVILIYPTELPRPLDATVGSIRIRSLAYSVDTDIEQSGLDLMHNLLNAGQSGGF